MSKPPQAPPAPPPRDMFGGRPIGGLGMPVQKAKNFKGTLRRLLEYLRPHRAGLTVVILAGVIGTVFTVLGPKILGLATTRIFEGFVAKARGVPGAAIDFDYVGRILLGLIVLYIAANSFQYLMQYLMANIAQRTVYALRRDVEAKFDRLPLKFFDSRTRGEVMSRAVNDLDSISGTLQQNLTQLLTSVLSLVGIIIMMLTISWILTLVVILTLPLSIVVVARVAKRSRPFFMKQQVALGALNGHVAEMYGGHTIVTAFGREQTSVATFDTLNGTYYDSAWRAQFVSGIIMPTMMFVGNIGYVLVAVIGGLLVTRRSLALGDVQAFIQYSRQFTMPIAQLSGIANTIQLTIVSAERVFELLDEPEEAAESADATVIPAPRGAVQFDAVNFRYKEAVPVIDAMALDIAPGQMVAIVGPTGAGKTTLVNLLMRFYDVDSGAIRVDGVDIRRLKRGALRRMFGMVLQDTWLFSGTIRENIAYGREGASEESIVNAAKAAQADHFIRTLPDNYDTPINEAASNLSAGQKQLLTIARAFLADPAILILDEATSSVDTRTEALIQRAMGELMRGRTTFVIAHRLSTIRNADVILMMEQGRIVEKGTHPELLAAKGRYAELYHSQFAGRAAQLAGLAS
ncbi:MAG TPA: ABC transporter ATP-binding protein [Vicinamibacterales bacterium]|jgi:ATP-binding cassette subfamily B protein|nr:ABC transporter ATP-binding protein [Vicinamibacterales bacterium]